MSDYRSLFDNAAIGIIETTADGKILAVNPGFALMFGFSSPDELIAEVPNILALYRDPAYREAFLGLLREFSQTKDFEIPLRHKDGRLLWVSANGRAVRDDKGQLVGVEGFVFDITSRKEIEVTLNLEREKLAEAQAITHVGSWEWDIVNNVVTWSKELCRIYGLSPSEFEASYEGFLQQVYFEDREFVKRVIDRSYEDRSPFEYVHRVVRPDGTVRTLHARGQPILDEEGNMIKIVGTGQDITEQQTIQERLRESLEQLKAVDAQRRLLLARLSDAHEEERVRIARELHDGLGQTLASISLFAKELEDDNPGAHAGRLADLRKIAEDAIVGIRAMVRNLRPVELDQLGLVTAVGRLAEDVGSQFGMAVSLRVWGEEARLGEPTEIAAYRMIQEATTNVVKHAEASSIVIEIGFEDEQLLVSIDDDGVGFERSQVSANAEHLGLINLDERASAVGGEVTVESRPGSGTSVRLRIPTHGDVKSEAAHGGRA